MPKPLPRLPLVSSLALAVGCLAVACRGDGLAAREAQPQVHRDLSEQVMAAPTSPSSPSGVKPAPRAAFDAGEPRHTLTRADQLVRDLCRRHAADRATLERYHDLSGARARFERMERFADDSRAELERIPFDELGVEGRIDATLLADEIESARRRAVIERAREDEIDAWLPFRRAIEEFHAEYREQRAGDPAALARRVDAVHASVEAARAELTAHLAATPDARAERPPARWRRAARRVDDLAGALATWYAFRAGYDPLFTWWVRVPHESAARALSEYAGDLRAAAGDERVPDETARQGGKPIRGEPIGREALLLELEFARIPYTPEELVAIADREMAWCTERMREAARDMGLADDWKAALERVKNAYVPPGEQPALVATLARDAIAFLEARDLITVPPVCAEAWRMSMLSPESQRTAPFFLGGEEVQVAFPTDAMTTDEKLMSMRGNNRHFAHATVFHELVPGHGLQQYHEARWNTHRREFGTPFWTEGWALYWEMRMWDLGYHATPEDKVGALFWRMHRCARIRFSLFFHLGTLSPEECITYLVDAVGHEPKNAEAEVRRSLEGGYGPLYQCAYMIGGLQFRALHAEIVGGGRASERAFHDAVMRGGNMPVEMVRARLLGTKLARGARPAWRFDG